MKELPIYTIDRFNKNIKKDLYINTFHQHLLEHDFIENSHSHDFYLLVLFTKGTGKHKIDNNTFQIKRGSLFVIQPGQVHSWSLSRDIEGYIAFYSKEIYNVYFGNQKLNSFSFYNSNNHISELLLNEREIAQISIYFELLIKENNLKLPNKIDKILNLLDCIHIEIDRKKLSENRNQQSSYLKKMEVFNTLLDTHYKHYKAPSFYADKMCVSLKHLNRMCKETYDKTVTELVAQRVVLESKRLLTFTSYPISKIAEELGYVNLSYFTKLFKKYTHKTPNEFRKKLKQENW